mgnify:CR=1 FL=1
MRLNVNGSTVTAAAGAEEAPLLFYLREQLGLVGAKFGCGVGLCGACTVLVDGRPARSCVMPVASVTGKDVTTIEGLAAGGKLHPVQEAWLAENVPQCGYCQAGQIMTAVGLLRAKPAPTDSDIAEAFAGALCRCGTYERIRRAVKRAANTPAGSTT